jgi:hypothetical protein
LRKFATAGRQHACTFDTLIYPGPENERIDLKTGSGLSSNDGIGFV